LEDGELREVLIEINSHLIDELVITINRENGWILKVLRCCSSLKIADANSNDYYVLPNNWMQLCPLLRGTEL